MGLKSEKFRFSILKIVICVIFLFPLVSTCLNNKTKTVETLAIENSTPEVEHFFTHCLIVNPSLAFRSDNFMANDYDKDCLTTSEFSKIIKSFYDNNYMLVNANMCFTTTENGKAIKKSPTLPKGKKPLIISIDDVNYDHRKMHLGMADKLAVDKNGTLCSIIDGKYDYEKEFVSVLNNFIAKHPDFSFKNSKAMLCLTGYDGILGYRTQTGNEQEIRQAKKVVEKLKADGYYFACHSYGHYHMKKVSNKTFKSEVELWKSEVEPLIGKTNIYVYPYGENLILENDQIAYKHQLLLNEGFKLFCGVGDLHFFSYYPFHTSSNNQVLFMDRRSMDGYSLRKHQKQYSEFFDCNKVYDSQRKVKI